jgi:putative spermidine/putrescine transport system substrate-binding protein
MRRLVPALPAANRFIVLDVVDDHLKFMCKPLVPLNEMTGGLMQARHETSAELYRQSARRRQARSSAVALIMVLLAASCARTSDGTSTAGDTEGGSKEAESSGELVIDSFGGAWGDALQFGLVEPFELETGIDVTLLQSSEVTRTRAAVEAGNPPPVDISDAGFAAAARLSRDGLLEPIDYEVFDPEVRDALPEDVQREYALTFGRIAYGLCFDNTVYPETGPQPSNWKDFWDVETFPGNRAMLSFGLDPHVEFPLLADGVPVEDLYPPDWDRAFEKLGELREVMPTWPEAPPVLHQLLVDGEATMIECFTHRMQTLIDSGLTRITMSFDQAKLFNEIFMVWKGSPNKDNAMRFLAYAMRPENQARWAQLAHAGPANPQAFELIPDDVAAKLPTSPDHKTTFVSNDEFWASVREDGLTNYEYATTVLWPEFIGG